MILSDYVFEKVFYIEDKLARLVQQFPRENKQDSFPFLSCDTYFFLCSTRVNSAANIRDIQHLNKGSKLYINGNILRESWREISQFLDKAKFQPDLIIIGDSDYPPSQDVLRALNQHCARIYCVNLVNEIGQEVVSIPLGLESQRYRSAGQLRDFKQEAKFEIRNRRFGVLVAWNDSTDYIGRIRAREILRPLTITTEVKKRITARSIHRFMRRSLFVACPRGNGLDTHRFWEALYLGAFPITLKKDEIPAFDYGPHLTLENWQEMSEFSHKDLISFYEKRASELQSFRNDALSRLETIFEA